MCKRRMKLRTIQQAAFEVLQEAGQPLKSIEIASRIMEQQLIESTAKSPIQSISQALERNIRMNKGNTPKLEFVDSIYGRQIQCTPETAAKQVYYSSVKEMKLPQPEEEVVVNLAKTLVDKVKIYQLAKGISSIDEAITELIRSGLTSSSSELIETLKKEMENL